MPSLIESIVRGFRLWNRRRIQRRRQRRRISYADWCARYDTLSIEVRSRLSERAARLPSAAAVDVLLPNSSATPARQVWLESLRDQLFANWRLHVRLGPALSEASARWWREQAEREPRIVCHSAPIANHDWWQPLREPGAAPWCALVSECERWRPHTLLLLVEALAARSDAVLAYGDEDRVDAAGRRHDPWFKGDFDLESLRGHDAIGRPSLWRSKDLLQCATAMSAATSAAEEFAPGGALWHDLALRVTEQVTADRVVHVPHVLCHRQDVASSDANRASGASASSAASTAAAAVRAVQAHLERRGIAARAEPRPDRLWPTVRVRFALPAVKPWVTIVIPTRNQLDMLRRCVTSILERTGYDQYDLVIVDNGSDDPQCLQWLAQIGERPSVRVQRDARAFNFASLNNAAVREARGEFVALLNDDVEVISRDWLEEMLSLAARPEIGAVGARLLYGDRTLQHGGVILGLQGAAGHVLKRLPGTDAGPGGRARLLQSYLAVTAACLVVRRALYEQVGGMDEAAFAVAFNDVDFCLKLHAAGYRNLWTPHAELFHHESISRGKEAAAVRRQRLELERAALCARWPQWVERDPHYNPNLTLKTDDFALAEPPREPLFTGQ